MIRSTLAFVVVVGVSLLLGGCLVSSSNSTYETGRRVSSATQDQIRLGETTETWLLAALGNPSGRADVEGQPGVEILRYDHQEHMESDGTVFFLFAGSTRRTTTSTTYFEITDGVVTRYWSE